MAVNGILLGQNISSDTAPLIFNVSDINNSEGIANFFAVLKNQEKPNVMIWHPDAFLLFYITNYIEDTFVEFMSIQTGEILISLSFSAEDTTYTLSRHKYREKTNTITLSSTKWIVSGDVYTQTVTVSGVSAIDTAQAIYVTPAEPNMTAYMEAGVYASAQAAGQITFTASKVPTTDLLVYIVIKQL